jgi:hypothetical protein
VFPCARQVFESLTDREKNKRNLVHLVTGGTAGLGDDLLHVLNLSLAADEGTELGRKYVSFLFGKDQ